MLGNLTQNMGMVVSILVGGLQPRQGGKILTMQWVQAQTENKKRIIYQRLPSMYGLQVSGTKLPTFKQCIAQMHGQEYLAKHYEEVFEAYVSDIFHEWELIWN